MKKIFAIVCLLSVLAVPVFAQQDIGKNAEIKRDLGTPVTYKLVWHAKSIAAASWSGWSDPVYIGDSSSLSVVLAYANTTTGTAGGDITLVYKLSGDGKNFAMPAYYRFYNETNSDAITNRTQAGTSATAGIFNTGADAGFAPNGGTNSSAGTASWVTSSNYVGPYNVTLTGITNMYLGRSPARYISFRMRNDGNALSVVDLGIMGK